MLEYTISKLHNAVGTVWMSIDGYWTQDLDKIKFYTLDDAKTEFNRLVELDLDYPCYELFDNAMDTLVPYYHKGLRRR
jgi:hypothetical protein